MEYMRRKLETDIARWASSARMQPLLIQGARRVGKTVLAERMLSLIHISEPTRPY